jgi:hypothetical protein
MNTKSEQNKSLLTKARSDSKLHSLTAKQRAEVDRWLFEENRSQQAVAELCRKEFSETVAPSIVGRYYHRERPRWELEQKAKAARAEAVTAPMTPAEAEAQYRNLLGRMIRVALDTAVSAEQPAERRVVADFAKVLISARRESHEALRVATTREKFEFDAATACLIHQVKTQAIAADESLDDGQRIQKIREELFGPDLPQ